MSSQVGRPRGPRTKPVTFKIDRKVLEDIEDIRWEMRMSKVGIFTEALKQFISQHKKQKKEVSG